MIHLIIDKLCRQKQYCRELQSGNKLDTETPFFEVSLSMAWYEHLRSNSNSCCEFVGSLSQSRIRTQLRSSTELPASLFDILPLPMTPTPELSVRKCNVKVPRLPYSHEVIFISIKSHCMLLAKQAL